MPQQAQPGQDIFSENAGQLSEIYTVLVLYTGPVDNPGMVVLEKKAIFPGLA